MTSAALHWLTYVVLGSGMLLLVGWLILCKMRQPAKRQSAGEWTVAAALILAVMSFAPAWWRIPISLPQSSKTTAPVVARTKQKSLASAPAPSRAEKSEPNLSPAVSHVTIETASPVENSLVDAPVSVEKEPEPTAAGSAPERETIAYDPHKAARSESSASLLPYLFVLYLCGAGYFLTGWIIGSWKLHRLLKRTRPLSDAERDQLTEHVIIPKSARVLVAQRLDAPFSCGLRRPTIVLPESLFRPVAEPLLRCVAVHEVAHLRRRDAAGTLVLQLGKTVFFFVPWFWWIARRVRLAREHLADDAVVRATGSAEDYAQLLLSWKATSVLPVGATGVLSNSSDLYRRISMLVEKKQAIEQRCSRRWRLTLICSLLAIAVAIAGVGFSSKAAAQAPDPEKPAAPKDDNKPAPPKADDKPVPPGLPDLPRELRELQDLIRGMQQGGNPKDFDELRKRIEEMQKRMMERMWNLPGGFPQPGALPNFPQPGALPNFPQPAFPEFERFGFRRSARNQERLGVTVQQPSATLVDQLDLPKGQGIVIEQVQKDSAAEKVGIKANDILLEIDGKAVPNDPRKLNEMLSKIKADQAVNVVVLRKGKNESLKGLKLPEARPARAAPFQFPGRPKLPPIPGGAVKGESTSISVSGNKFNGTYKSGDVQINVKGVLEDNKPRVTDVVVKDGDKQSNFNRIEDVPEQYRKKAERLVPNRGLPRPRGRQID